jgi:hypothetical protein
MNAKKARALRKITGGKKNPNIHRIVKKVYDVHVRDWPRVLSRVDLNTLHQAMGSNRPS